MRTRTPRADSTSIDVARKIQMASGERSLKGWGRKNATQTRRQAESWGGIMRDFIIVAALAAASLGTFAQVPAGYPADYAQVVAAAKIACKVVIYSALDTKAASPLLK